jgi:hypothetical protein
VDFDFDAYDPNFSLSYVDWRDDYSPSDVGMTFIAPTDAWKVERPFAREIRRASLQQVFAGRGSG